ncbi:hypothetical protein H5410_020541 [Solanum commersonii]|uniref:Uncharacterized protein n=1 Tax=Solanum commersonii TaxID=4109 RepID=A0A9J5ZCP5_SOLCO|nr:hypothetical protein H5410_020541 [Solanum commersonii]
MAQVCGDQQEPWHALFARTSFNVKDGKRIFVVKPRLELDLQKIDARLGDGKIGQLLWHSRPVQGATGRRRHSKIEMSQKGQESDGFSDQISTLEAYLESKNFIQSSYFHLVGCERSWFNSGESTEEGQTYVFDAPDVIFVSIMQRQLTICFFIVKGIRWTTGRTGEALTSWNFVGGGSTSKNRWEIIPAEILWAIWKERNSRCFEGNNSSMQKLKMNCIISFCYWCSSKYKDDPIWKTKAPYKVVGFSCVSKSKSSCLTHETHKEGVSFYVADVNKCREDAKTISHLYIHCKQQKRNKKHSGEGLSKHAYGGQCEERSVDGLKIRQTIPNRSNLIVSRGVSRGVQKLARTPWS